MSNGRTLRDNGAIEPGALVQGGRIAVASQRVGAQDAGECGPVVQVGGGLDAVGDAGETFQGKVQSVSREGLRGTKAQARAGNAGERTEAIEPAGTALRGGVEDDGRDVGAGKVQDGNP